MTVTINYIISGGGGGGGGLGTIAGASDYATATLPTETTQKMANGIPFSATTAVATAPAPTGTFTPVSSTAPPGGFNVLVCNSNAGSFPAAIDGITSMALNDSLEYSPALGVWVLNKATISIADLTDHAAVAQLNSSQQTEVAGGATVALLNSGKTALKDPAGGSDIPFTNVTHLSNYTPSSTQTGVSTESSVLMSLTLGILPAGTVIDIQGQITGNSDAGTTTLRLKFGTTTLFTFLNGSAQTLNSFVARIVCTGSAAQCGSGEMRTNSTSPAVQSPSTTVDTSTSTVLNLTLQNSSTTRTSVITFLDVLVRQP